MAKKQSGTISKRMQKRAEQRRKKRLTQAIIALIAIVILAGGVWAVLGGNAPDADSAQSSLPRNIDVDQAYEMYQASEFVLDVRTQEEWDDYHIPGTTLIPLDQLENRLNEVPRDQDVVVICRSGNRSQVGRDILLDAGFTNVTSVDGGVSTWRDSGYPIE
jgi:rhodanese-related sulfurtransferase